MLSQNEVRRRKYIVERKEYGMVAVYQQRSEISQPTYTVPEEKIWHKHVVNVALLIIVAFQVINLPGAILNKNILTIMITLPGLMLCGLAFLFHRRGKISVVSVLLIVIVNLGCSLTLLTAPGGLDVGNLPVFDMLIVSELIAVSLLPARSVFLVALANALFTLVDITFQPHTAALGHFLASNMGYTAIVHPLSLQVVVAMVTYIWVRSTQSATARADRAEEIAQLRKREADRKQQLDANIEEMSQVLVRAANGDRSVRVNLSQDNVLWRVGNLLNLLVTRLAKTSQIEQENLRLRVQVAQLTEVVKKASASSQQVSRQSSK
jgi:hypothetical protein